MLGIYGDLWWVWTKKNYSVDWYYVEVKLVNTTKTKKNPKPLIL